MDHTLPLPLNLLYVDRHGWDDEEDEARGGGCCVGLYWNLEDAQAEQERLSRGLAGVLWRWKHGAAGSFVITDALHARVRTGAPVLVA